MMNSTPKASRGARHVNGNAATQRDPFTVRKSLVMHGGACVSMSSKNTDQTECVLEPKVPAKSRSCTTSRNVQRHHTLEEKKVLSKQSSNDDSFLKIPLRRTCTTPPLLGHSRTESVPCDGRDIGRSSTYPGSTVEDRLTSKSDDTRRSSLKKIGTFELQTAKLRYINAEARRLHQSRPGKQDCEVREFLQEAFKDVCTAVKKSGPVYDCITSYGQQLKRRTSEHQIEDYRCADGYSTPKQVMRRSLSKILALRTFKDMSACREEFRETCLALHLDVGVGEGEVAHIVDPDESCGKVEA